MSQPIQKLNIQREDLGGVVLTNGEIVIWKLEEDATQIAYTLVEFFEKIKDNSITDQNILTGSLMLVFKNDGIPFDYGFRLTYEGFTARAEITVTKGKILTHIVQYLFDVMDSFVREFRPTNMQGEVFNLPAFQYSEGYFESFFPKY